ncbi:hypothetical protein [Streptomyces acidiscabies]|uniref:hypothetical protein n=1 Tax=Streptomyces acidiscabies TaxID=42234 RepID=UPI0038F7FC0B
MYHQQTVKPGGAAVGVDALAVTGAGDQVWLTIPAALSVLTGGGLMALVRRRHRSG